MRAQHNIRSSNINSSGRVRRVWLDDKSPTAGLIPPHSTAAGGDSLAVLGDVFSLNLGGGGDDENPSGAAALCQKHSDLEKKPLHHVQGHFNPARRAKCIEVPPHD